MNITDIVVSVLGLVVSFISVWATKVLLPKFSAWLDAKMTKAQRENTWGVVRSLVEAAQQMYENNQDKFDFVVKELAKKNIIVDRATIESAVYNMKNEAMDVLYKTIVAENTPAE